jgi:transposase
VSTTQMTVCPMMVMAIEIASAKWVVASTAGGNRKVRRKVLSQAQPEERFAALVAEIAEARRKLGVADDARVVVGYEAGHEGFWLVRALRERGVETEVIDPVSLQVDRRSKRAKTDRLDAEALVSGLWRWVRGDAKALRVLRVPSEDAEDAREWQRERDRLMRERRACTDRIIKKLRTHGIWKLPPKWRSDLREGRLRTFAGQPLGSHLQHAMTVELSRLELVEAKLKELTAKARELDPASATRIERLQSLRGIGSVGARGLSLLLYWRRFDNRRQVGACVGMVGTPYDSGTMRQDQGISKAGDPRLRALLVELSWLWLRLQPNSAITQWFRERTQGAGKRGRRIMIVAVARKLAIALWRYVEFGELPKGATMKPVAV